MEMNLEDITATNTTTLMMTTTVACPPFNGDGREGEDSKAWFKTFRRETVDWNEEKKKKNFELYLVGDAEKWIKDPKTDSKVSWKALSEAFLKRFPSITDTEESKSMAYERLTACVLKEEELGKSTWDDNRKKDVPNHTAWAYKIVRLAAAYGDTGATTLPFIRSICLPRILNEILENQYDNYGEFAEAVSKIKLAKLRSACEKLKTIEDLKVEVQRLNNTRTPNTWSTPQAARSYSGFITPSPTCRSNMQNTPATPQSLPRTTSYRQASEHQSLASTLSTRHHRPTIHHCFERMHLLHLVATTS
ncbi:hypothetical protein M422DRAFT_52223 [Sphaerobolus stellatus SS14]|uniref:Unplaced genomic scaffold SPHSTscaffold_131, whole genome shotgun sequence n=1 Tax=Sphaerobolus stellatus (strain SS14) TaxID=990650 RepID=A0A0C9UXC9_SPHS4|nr:hypothetical protein M422DRAFT_52223 [Sphaerobolus stellatus SS14]